MRNPGRCRVLRQIAAVKADGLLLAGPTLNNQAAADGGGRGNTDNERTQSRFHHGVPPKGELLAAEGKRLKTIYSLLRQWILIAVKLRGHTLQDGNVVALAHAEVLALLLALGYELLCDR